MTLTEEQQRAAESLMADMEAEGWEAPPDLQEAVYEAFMTGHGAWRGLVITVTWQVPA